jgi:hypothetical protein
MRITFLSLAFLCGTILFNPATAHAQACPSGQYAHGRCMDGAAKPTAAKPAMRKCPGGRYMGRCIQ